MQEPFKINESALEELFPQYYDLRNNTPKSVQLSQLPETETKKITLLFTGLKSLNQQQREFIRKVLSAIGVKGQETLAHFGDSFDAVLEDSLKEYPSSYVFLWGHGLSTVKGQFYSNIPLGDSQILLLNDLKTTMTVVEEKRKLWALIQKLSF